jgi:hypothetical protein
VTETPRRMDRRLLFTALALGFACCVWAGAAQASERLSDVNVSDVSLQVNARGEALITYHTQSGAQRHVLAWGAENAVAPSADAPQQTFQLDYAGGWRKYKRSISASFHGACRPYDGPSLVYLVTACDAPDGSYWAIQSWQRVLPLRGVEPFATGQGAWEVHLSHWTGPPATLEVSPHWTYDHALQGLFGRLLYNGSPVYGFRTPSSSKGDRNARYFYIDTFNSAYGPGWRRDGAKVAHRPNGAFCYSFAPLAVAPAGYPSVPKVSGVGERSRVTVMGPGVTPDVQWEGGTLGAYDAGAEKAFSELFDQWVGDDPACAAER